MTPKQRIIEICNDPNFNEYQLVDAIETELAKVIPFDHESDSTMDACGITNNIMLNVMHEGSKSETIERIEQSLSKRKLAFVFFQTIEKSKSGVGGIDKIPSGHPLGKLLSKLEDFSEFLDQLSEESESPIGGQKSLSSCKEEDDSECWKCSLKKDCTKFKGYQQN